MSRPWIGCAHRGPALRCWFSHAMRYKMQPLALTCDRVKSFRPDGIRSVGDNESLITSQDWRAYVGERPSPSTLLSRPHRPAEPPPGTRNGLAPRFGLARHPGPD